MSDGDPEPGIATEGISYFERYVNDLRAAHDEFTNTTHHDPQDTATFKDWLADEYNWTKFPDWLHIHKPRLTGKQDKED